MALTSNYNDVQLFEALKAQAAACLSKEITAEQLVETVWRVALGEHPINETLVSHPILADQVLMSPVSDSSQRHREFWLAIVKLPDCK